MARRHRVPRRITARPGRATRRRLLRAAGLLAGAALAAGSGWFYAGPHAPDTGRRPATANAATPVRPSLPFGLPAADPSLQGGALQVPVVDVTEILPTCHN
jgi:hypothetical protein